MELTLNPSNAGSVHAVQCLYKAVNFLTNIHKRHLIARPLGHLLDILPQFPWWFIQYLTKLDHVITLNCTWAAMTLSAKVNIIFLFPVCNDLWYFKLDNIIQIGQSAGHHHFFSHHTHKHHLIKKIVLHTFLDMYKGDPKLSAYISWMRFMGYYDAPKQWDLRESGST